MIIHILVEDEEELMCWAAPRGPQVGGVVVRLHLDQTQTQDGCSSLYKEDIYVFWMPAVS